MAKLKIKNFGPITEGYSENNGFMNISPVSIIIGNQATGKSTIAKLYSTLSWLEKNLSRIDTKKNYISTKEEFFSFLKNQRIEEYLKDNSYIEYIGEAFHFKYESNKFSIVPLDSDTMLNYIRPKIMYVPSERNLITVLEDADNVGKLPIMLSVLLDEYNIARKTLAKEPFDLPVPGVQVLFSNDTQTTKVIHNNSSISISNASSGIQSITPLILVSQYLSNELNITLSNKISSLSAYKRDYIKNYIKDIYKNDSLLCNNLLEEFNSLFSTTTENANKYTNILKDLLSGFFNQCFINIVEEPEQNLYPDSQGNVLYKLLEYNNLNENNHLVITTHSPYILFYITLAVEAWDLIQKKVPIEQIDTVINSKAAINPQDLTIYETLEDGTIKQLEKKDILPSDEDLLNNAIQELSNKFAQLLKLEEKYC